MEEVVDVDIQRLFGESGSPEGLEVSEVRKGAGRTPPQRCFGRAGSAAECLALCFLCSKKKKNKISLLICLDVALVMLSVPPTRVVRHGAAGLLEAVSLSPA